MDYSRLLYIGSASPCFKVNVNQTIFLYHRWSTSTSLLLYCHFPFDPCVLYYLFCLFGELSQFGPLNIWLIFSEWLLHRAALYVFPPNKHEWSGENCNIVDCTYPTVIPRRNLFQQVVIPWICFENILQALLAIFDSPLTKAGRLQAVYVKTEKGVLFEIKPYVRMPRTFKRFCGLMCKLLINLYTLCTLCASVILIIVLIPDMHVTI